MEQNTEQLITLAADWDLELADYDGSIIRLAESLRLSMQLSIGEHYDEPELVPALEQDLAFVETFLEAERIADLRGLAETMRLDLSECETVYDMASMLLGAIDARQAELRRYVDLYLKPLLVRKACV